MRIWRTSFAIEDGDTVSLDAMDSKCSGRGIRRAWVSLFWRSSDGSVSDAAV